MSVSTANLYPLANQTQHYQEDTRSVSLTSSKVRKLVLGALTIYAIANVPTASAGIFTGVATFATCVGAGLLFPASLFWAAAPCYELTMVVTANPLLP